MNTKESKDPISATTSKSTQTPEQIRNLNSHPASQKQNVAGLVEEDYLRKTYEYFLESPETDPIPTLVIAKALFGSKATKKSINRFLYALAAQQLIVKRTNENGSEPRWELA